MLIRFLRPVTSTAEFSFSESVTRLGGGIAREAIQPPLSKSEAAERGASLSDELARVMTLCGVLFAARQDSPAAVLRGHAHHRRAARARPPSHAPSLCTAPSLTHLTVRITVARRLVICRYSSAPSVSALSTPASSTAILAFWSDERASVFSLSESIISSIWLTICAAG